MFLLRFEFRRDSNNDSSKVSTLKTQVFEWRPSINLEVKIIKVILL